MSRLFAILWAVAHQAPLSMGFSTQVYWSGLPCLLQAAIFGGRQLEWIGIKAGIIKQSLFL